MAVLDFPDVSDSPWYNPDTGITYVWRNGAWHIASGTDTDIFVSKTGDNMTGDLTLGTDKITLDATNGEANFAGYVQINSSPTTANPGLIVSAQHNAGDLGGWIRLADVNTGIARSQWGFNLSVNDVTFDLVGAGTGLRIRNSTADLQSAIDIVDINSTNNSVTFAGNIFNTTWASGLGYALQNDANGGSIGIQTLSTASGNAFSIARGGTSTVSFTAQGFATFASAVACRNYVEIIRPSDTSAALLIKRDGGSSSTILYGNGGAIFSGLVTFNGGTSGATGRAIELNGDIGIQLEPDNDANYTATTDAEGNETRVYNGPTLDVKERLQNLIARLDALEADELAEDATSTLLLTTVNNLNADMAKTKAALTAIRTAANVAGTLEQLKADIVTATADI